MVRLAVLAAALVASADAFTVTITNECSGEIDLYTRLASVYTDESETIAAGASVEKTIEKGYEGHFRNGTSDAATLVEFATKGDLDLAWYDIGIIPPRLKPGFEYCKSLQECKDNSESGIGYNTPVQVTPQSNTGVDTCRQITCLADGCEDAYNYPQDDTKTHSCAFGTDFIVTFCPSGDSTTQQSSGSQDTTQQTSSGSTTQEETPAPVVTEAPATEDTATDAPVQQASAASDNGAGKVHSQDDGVNGESETTAPEVTPAVTPAANKSKYCV
ncbi:Thaumatin [Phytophthora megakarya]|uniref:Thaumatin n=1 Tax=Phytophthora megakarya TaxID=4795 RepID=A0A225W0L4_9STRA|nr:Thaumatin [Phytophthora megakarya]